MAINLARGGYTHEEVENALLSRSGSRKIRFRYHLLDREENKLADITSLVQSGSIEQSAFAEIKRSGKFTLKEEYYYNNGEQKYINWNTDRVQPFMDILIPGTRDWVSFSLGVFLVSTPVKEELNNLVMRNLEAYDKLLILKEDKLTERYTINKGTKYYDSINEILLSTNETKINIEDNGKKLERDKEFEPGTSKLQMLNEIASDINFTPIWVDEYGFYRSHTYRSPQEKPTDYTYQADELSVIGKGMEEELDMFDLPNVFTITVSSPDEDDINLISTVENNNPNHPRSIPALGRRVVRFEEKEDIADQESLDAYVERIAFESSQIYGRVRFKTALMPFHSYSNVLRIKNKTLGINDKYSEVSWKMDLKAGSLMDHECRKVISLI